jgi:branched-chain amino acid transport system ATP-binding protein
MRTICEINRAGVTIFLVEQNLALVQPIVSRVYQLEEGMIVGLQSGAATAVAS